MTKIRDSLWTQGSASKAEISGFICSLKMARELHALIIRDERGPLTTDEIWYAVDAQFVQDLKRLIAENTDSSICSAHKESLPVNLPEICNKQNIDLSHVERYGLSTSTPFLHNKLSQFTDSGENLPRIPCENEYHLISPGQWNIVKSLVKYDFEVPRKVIETKNKLLAIEIQPILFWIALVHSPFTFTEEPEKLEQASFSRSETFNHVLQCAEKLFSVKDTLCFVAPITARELRNQDGSLNISSQIQVKSFWGHQTLAQLSLTSPHIVYVVANKPCSESLPDHDSVKYFSPTNSETDLAKDLEKDSARSQYDSSKFSDSTAELIERSICSLNSSDISMSAACLSGFQNLGNTCFMNSALQCLIHTDILSTFFLTRSFEKDINTVNPLGMKGRLAWTYAEFLKEAWCTKPATYVAEKSSIRAPIVTPRALKIVFGAFSPQFLGYRQHDSHEFTAFLLDGLHEDLNRIIDKPCYQIEDSEMEKPDEVLAEESWNRHLSRNDSIIVDTFQGQYRSRLQCPKCSKVSVVFDPFMYLSLPLPPTSRFAILYVALISAYPTASENIPVLRMSLALTVGMPVTEVKSCLAKRLAEIVLKCREIDNAPQLSSVFLCGNAKHQFCAPVNLQALEKKVQTFVHSVNSLMTSQSEPKSDNDLAAVLERHLLLMEMPCLQRSFESPDKNSKVFSSNEPKSLYRLLNPAMTVSRYLPQDRYTGGNEVKIEALLLPENTVKEKVDCYMAKLEKEDLQCVDYDEIKKGQHASISEPLSYVGATRELSLDPVDCDVFCNSNERSENCEFPETKDDAQDWIVVIFAYSMENTCTSSYYESLFNSQSSPLKFSPSPDRQQLCFKDIRLLRKSTTTLKQLYELVQPCVASNEIHAAGNWPFTIKIAGVTDELLTLRPCPRTSLGALFAAKGIKCLSNQMMTAIIMHTSELSPALAYDMLTLNDEDYLSNAQAKIKEKDQIPLSACLEEFLKTEQLAPDNMWFCSKCQEHVPASKID